MGLVLPQLKSTEASYRANGLKVLREVVSRMKDAKALEEVVKDITTLFGCLPSSLFLLFFLAQKRLKFYLLGHNDLKTRVSAVSAIVAVDVPSHSLDIKREVASIIIDSLLALLKKEGVVSCLFQDLGTYVRCNIASIY